MTLAKVKVYYRRPPSFAVGPLGYWATGDAIALPDGTNVIVAAVELDGMAVAWDAEWLRQQAEEHDCTLEAELDRVSSTGFPKAPINVAQEVRLWHDDVRPAPEGWTWAKTNAAALAVLRARPVAECSLDHDLGSDDVGNPLARGSSPDGTGYDLVVAMLDEDLVPPKVTIHSWNHPAARRMAQRLADFGHFAVVAPFQIDAFPIGGARVSGLGTCSKCDDHNHPCVCTLGCDCGGHHR